MSHQRLPAEWEPQDAILLSWPHSDACADDILDDLVQLFEALVSVICDYADVIIAIPAEQVSNVKARLQLMEVPLEYVYCYPAESKNISVRDYGPIGVQTVEGIRLLVGDVEKSSCTESQAVIDQLQQQAAFPCASLAQSSLPLNITAIDRDGQACLLTTSDYLKHLAQHSDAAREAVDAQLREQFGVTKINTLDSSFFSGENNPFEIDALARCCPNNTIVYTACDDEQDKYYEPLKKLQQELQQLTNAEGEPFRLLPLPWTGAVCNDAGHRVFATYTYFLVVNEAVLVPIYDLLSDEDALEIVAQAFQGFEIFGIPSTVLLEQGTNLHRIAVQLPEGVLMQA